MTPLSPSDVADLHRFVRDPVAQRLASTMGWDGLARMIVELRLSSKDAVGTAPLLAPAAPAPDDCGAGASTP